MWAVDLIRAEVEVITVVLDIRARTAWVLGAACREFIGVNPALDRSAVLEAYPHHLSVAAALQSCGKGCSVWSRLAMRRRPRVNQDVMLRRTRLGCWSGRLRSAGVAWWRASHWPVETAR